MRRSDPDWGISVSTTGEFQRASSPSHPKLQGLADFAESYGDAFRRIESVAETNGVMRVLDLTREHVREAVWAAQEAKALYGSNVANNY